MIDMPNPNKPQKPRADFPLFAHDRGKWAKKIKGKLVYFGRWDDPDGAEAEYHRFLGRTDKVSVDRKSVPGAITLADACNAFLAAKDTAAKAGTISPRTFLEYKLTLKRLVDFLGRATPAASVTPASWAAFRAHRSAKLGIVAIGNEVTRIKTMGNWLYASRLIREPIHFGPEFRKASAKSLRKHRRESGAKLFSAAQIHALLDEAGTQMRAMILLGINCGFGNTDVCTITRGAIKDGWIDFPRPKTEVGRRIPLWKETLEALGPAMGVVASQSGDLAMSPCFKIDGGPWHPSEHVSKRFRVLLAWAGIQRGGFYWLRHTFATVADGAKDPIAVSALMGHADGTIGGVYRETISDDRLIAVTDRVRSWLFG
jgi:integrase